MSHLPQAAVTILGQPHLHPEAVRVEVECRYLMTGLTQVPGLMQALTREQMVTAAVFEHEAQCGRCDTASAHERGDRRSPGTDRSCLGRAADGGTATLRRQPEGRMSDLEERHVSGEPADELAACLGSVRDRQRRGEPPRVGRVPRPSPPRLRRTPAPKWKRR